MSYNYLTYTDENGMTDIEQYFKSNPIQMQMQNRTEIKMTGVKPVEEPKNVAVKTLVDKLKAEQTGLASAKNMVEFYKTQRKQAQDNINTQNKTKNEKEKNIKELSTALKKLGHKE